MREGFGRRDAHHVRRAVVMLVLVPEVHAVVLGVPNDHQTLLALNWPLLL